MFYKVPLKFAAYVVVSHAMGLQQEQITAGISEGQKNIYKIREEENKEKAKRKKSDKLQIFNCLIHICVFFFKWLLS